MNFLKKALKFTPGKGYDKLVKNLNTEFFELERSLRQLTTESLRRAGKYIDDHILENKDRADYGRFLFDQLEKDTGKDAETLRKILKFSRLYPISVPARKLSWGYYQRLIGVRDPKERKQLEEKIVKEDWNTKDLREYLSQRRKLKEVKNKDTPIPRLEFTRGRLGVFEVIKDDDNQNQGGLVLDFGFRETVPLPEGGEYKEGDFIQVTSDGKKRSAVKVDVKKEEIYTYKAQVKKVIDADTLIVRFGVEFGIAVRWKLRLRGINCPEIDTEEGKRAKRFVELRLKDCEFVVIKTYKDSTDKYDRYLADIFYPPPELWRAGLDEEIDPLKVASEGNYLNQELLDERLAWAY